MLNNSIIYYDSYTKIYNSFLATFDVQFLQQLNYTCIVMQYNCNATYIDILGVILVLKIIMPCTDIST